MVRHMIIGGENKCQTKKLKLENKNEKNWIKGGQQKVEPLNNIKSGRLNKKKKEHNYLYGVGAEDND